MATLLDTKAELSRRRTPAEIAGATRRLTALAGLAGADRADRADREEVLRARARVQALRAELARAQAALGGDRAARRCA